MAGRTEILRATKSRPERQDSIGSLLMERPEPRWCATMRALTWRCSVEGESRDYGVSGGSCSKNLRSKANRRRPVGSWRVVR